ncbi:transcriptional adapter 3-A [Halyomorpha halys]|uniref:transcriptional adapter 3-A n=1 Tax=Halyomorpha halys TaxID=286706 RepID=UPI0006D527AE|nr:transcriptional adapter 3-A [Halyomorpha halys]
MKTKYSSKKESKGKDSANYQSNGKHKDGRSQSSETTEEFDFAFPILQTVDRTRHLHCYSSILARSKDEPVTMEDLDRLQPELEVMFSCAAIRVRTLKGEIAALTNAEENKAEIKPVSLVMSQKKRKLSDARFTKSLKDLSKVRNRDGLNKECVSSENDTDNSGDVVNETPAESSKVTLPKNDTPNKFWAYVEPYAKDITKENIKDLEDLVAACDTDLAGVSIPPLGRHYSASWAEEDLNQERGSSDKAEISGMIKKAATLCERTPGPLVQRLVSALMEDPSNDSFSKLDSDSDSCPYLSKLPLFHTTACFERRLKRELEAVGFLDGENDDNDEIMTEIKKCDEELKIVAAQNKEQIELLISKAKYEMKRQEVKSRIRTIETELTEIYRKTTAAKLKKKQLKKKEKDQAWKILKKREQLLKTLENM